MRWIVWCSCLLVLFACSGEKKKEEVSIHPSVKAETMVIEPVTLSRVRSFPGHVRSKVSITLAAKMPGYVKQVPVQIGDMVHKGDLLVLMDDTDAKARVRALVSAKKAALAELHAASAEYEYSRINFDRFSRLYRQESATKDEFDRARTSYTAMKNKVMAIKANIRRIEAQLREARNQLLYVRIEAPVDGWVSERHADPGTYINPGHPLIGLDGRGSGFWFEADVDEALYTLVKPGGMVSLSIPSANMSLQARTVHVQRSSRPLSHTFTILVDLGRADLKSGLFGRVFLDTGSTQAIVVPLPAVVKRGGITGVYSVDKSGTIKWRLIKTGREWRKTSSGYMPVLAVLSGQAAPVQKWVSVLSGLSPGDRIVISNLSEMREGLHLE